MVSNRYIKNYFVRCSVDIVDKADIFVQNLQQCPRRGGQNILCVFSRLTRLSALSAHWGPQP